MHCYTLIHTHSHTHVLLHIYTHTHTHVIVHTQAYSHKQGQAECAFATCYDTMCMQTGPFQPHHVGAQAEHATKGVDHHDRHTAGKLTVECVLPPNVHGELERVPGISGRHSNSVDVWAGFRMDLDQRFNLCKHLQRCAEVHIHREDFSLVVGSGDVGDHVGVHLVVRVQHSAAVPLDQRGVQQRYLLHLHHALLIMTHYDHMTHHDSS